MKKFLSILFGVVLICFFIGCSDDISDETAQSDGVIQSDESTQNDESTQSNRVAQSTKVVQNAEAAQSDEMNPGNIREKKFTYSSSSVYTGEGQSADVKLNGKPLPEGYTVIYKKDNEFFNGNLPQDVGAYEVYVKEGSNEEICIGIFEITSAELDISIKQEGVPKYNGREQEIKFSKKSTTVGNTEVTFEYKKKGEESYKKNLPKFTDAGSYTVHYKASAKNHKVKEGDLKVRIDKASVSDLDFSWTQESVYTGKTQNTDVKLNGNNLNLKFYEIFYKKSNCDVEPCDVGEYKVYVQATDDNKNCTGSKYIGDFTITAKNIEINISDIADQIYTSHEIKPSIEVKSDSLNSNKGIEYDVEYVNNVNVGDATVKVICKGNYTGEASRTFKIEYLAFPEEKYELSGGVFKDNTYWSNNEVTVKAPRDYKLVCDEGEKESIVVESDRNANSIEFRLKNQSGQITDVIKVKDNIKFDRSEPVGEIIVEGKDKTESAENIFVKGDTTIKIKAEDNESGIKSVEYYIDENCDKIDPTKWKSVAGTDLQNFSEGVVLSQITSNGKHAVYVKITDYAGNVKCLNIDSLIKYEYPILGEDRVTYLKNSNNEVKIHVTLNDNIIVESEYFKVTKSENDECYLIFNNDKLNSISDSSFKIPIKFRPMCVENISFEIQTDIILRSVNIVNLENKCYDGKSVDPKYEGNLLGDKATYKYYIYDDSAYKEIEGPPKNVGSYSVKLIVENDLYKTVEINKKFEITPAELQVTCNTKTKIYDGDPMNIEATINGLVGNEKAEVELSDNNQHINVGKYECDYKIVYKDGASYSNYKEINHKKINFEIIARPIKILPHVDLDTPYFDVLDSTGNFLARSDGPCTCDFSITSSNEQLFTITLPEDWIGCFLDKVDIKYTIKDSKRNDVTNCFTVSWVDGSMTDNNE